MYRVSTTFWHLTIHNPDSPILRQSTKCVPSFPDPFVPGCSSRQKLMLRMSGKQEVAWLEQRERDYRLLVFLPFPLFFISFSSSLSPFLLLLCF